MLAMRTLKYTALIFLLVFTRTISANHELFEIDAGDYEYTVNRFSPDKTKELNHLLLWISPGFGNTERVFNATHKLADNGIETWHIDIADNLFLPRSTHTLRSVDGKHISRLIHRAHQVTGKKITLISRAYGAIPVLHGAREWQQSYSGEKNSYLTGAILFSPELYSHIPPLGQDAEYMPVTTATSIPIMLVQAGNRGNRWQLGDLVEKLESGGSLVSIKLLKNVTGVFYHEDTAAPTLAYNKIIDREIIQFIKLLDDIDTPSKITAMQDFEVEPRPLDLELKKYTGKFTPPALKLADIDGVKYERNSYEGQVTVINFWASWCGPCVEEIPALNNLRKRMADKAFELISVNYAEDKQTVEQFMKEVQVDFPVLMDETGKISSIWKVLVYPATYVIAPDGNISYAVNGAIHWDSDDVIQQLNALLK